MADQIPDLFWRKGYLPPQFVWNLANDGYCVVKQFTLRRRCILFDLMCLSRTWAVFCLRRVLVALTCHRKGMRLHVKEFLFHPSISRLISMARPLRPGDSAERNGPWFLVNALGFSHREFGVAIERDLIQDHDSSTDDDDVQFATPGYIVPNGTHGDTQFININMDINEPMESPSSATFRTSSYDQLFTIFLQTSSRMQATDEDNVGVRPHSITVSSVEGEIGHLAGVRVGGITIRRQTPNIMHIGEMNHAPGFPQVIVIVCGFQNTLRVCSVFKNDMYYTEAKIQVRINAFPLPRLHQGAIYLHALLRLSNTLTKVTATEKLSDVSWNTNTSFRRLKMHSYRKTFEAFWCGRCVGCGCKTKIVLPESASRLCVKCMHDGNRPGLQHISKTVASRYVEDRKKICQIKEMRYINVYWRIHLLPLRKIIELNAGGAQTMSPFSAQGSPWGESLY